MTQDEILDTVDEEDNVIGRRPWKECVERGILHRAIVVILLDSSMMRTYVQKRSASKSFFPSLWSASCTGHVSSGESYLEGARREVSEELGLSDVKLQELFKFLSPKWKFGSKTEWEYITVFEGNTQDRPITLQESEVEEGRYVSLEEVKDLLAHHEDSFTPDSVIAFNGYYRLKAKS